jgi:hypothetical protein
MQFARPPIIPAIATVNRRSQRMQISLVAVLCHSIGAFVPEAVNTLPVSVCREVIVIKDDLPMQSCMLSQPALADWKGRSIYRSDQWWITQIKCVPGDYVPKERV